MLSSRHEILVELFRNCGALAPELLRLCAEIELDCDHIEVTSIDLSQVVSTEYRADAVFELRDRDNTTVSAVVVEVQLAIDNDKLYTWPLYVAALRAKQRCPVYLLVFTPDHAVVRWARRPIELGHPDFHMKPLVMLLDEVPRIIDPEYARKLPELAVLSTMANPELEVATVAVNAIAPLPGDQKQLYLDVILAQLPEAIRKLLEFQMQGYQYQSEFARKYFNQGREEGHQQGREEGHQQGLQNGRAEGLRVAARALTRDIQGDLTSDDVAVIDAVHDEQALTELVRTLRQASSRAEVRAAFELVLGRAHRK